jgi:hypothetical protein
MRAKQALHSLNLASQSKRKEKNNFFVMSAKQALHSLQSTASIIGLHKHRNSQD